MVRELRTSLLALLVLTLLTGGLYPLLVTGASRALWSSQASGSLRVHKGVVVGSTLIGQAFDSPRYFWGRPSATAPQAYNAGASAASNQSVTNPAFGQVVRDRVNALRAADPENHRPIPWDLVTASGSGLDPHVSPEAARYQVSRIAKARGIPEATVESIIPRHEEGPSLGVLGERRVNVLELNLELDSLSDEQRP